MLRKQHANNAQKIKKINKLKRRNNKTGGQ